MTASGPPFPTSEHKGPLFSLDASCNEFGSEHRIQLLSEGHPDAGAAGTAYIDSSHTVIPAEHSGDFVADEIEVNCEPTPTKQPEPFDTDGDGCADVRENGPDEKLGGQRDYLNPWDFYDVNGGHDCR